MVSFWAFAIGRIEKAERVAIASNADLIANILHDPFSRMYCEKADERS